MTTFSAHGKLLITGEYFVLDGAIALALPTKLGQRLSVEHQQGSKGLHWTSLDLAGKPWLEGVWSPDELAWKSINEPEKAAFLSQLLCFAQRELSIDLEGFRVQTQLEFPQEWGLGSSSTLLALLAQWWHCDPHELLRNSFGGSGYDIACATAASPILYQLVDAQPKVETAIQMPFTDKLYFVYLGKKQDSREGIKMYRKLGEDRFQWIPEISDITRKLLRCEDFDELEYLLMLHETIVSRALGLEKVRDLYFSDFPGAVKSLGAWGGDFVLATADEAPEDVRQYFKDKGFDVVIPYREMALQA
jgi:mevalonate kinase